MRRMCFLTMTVSMSGCGGLVDVPPTPIDPAPQIAEAAPPPSLGALEHRGRRHELRDLLGADYRAASNDPFVRDFDPDRAVAVVWAGL